MPETFSLPFSFKLLYVFFFGLCLGSFLNVCIYRIPRGYSIVFPGSSCPFCGHSLKWWENIPLLSYLILGAKCRFCKSFISLRYFLVELLTGLGGAFLYYRFQFNFWLFLFYLSFFAFLIIIFFIDLDNWIIPDEVVYPGMAIGILGSFLLLGLKAGFLSLAGAVVSYLSFYLLSVLGSFFARQEALGYGDVKFSALLGAFLGFSLKLAMGYLFAFLLGGFYAVFLLALFKKSGKTPLPFGTFMALGAFLGLLGGEAFFFWYLELPTQIFLK